MLGRRWGGRGGWRMAFCLFILSNIFGFLLGGALLVWEGDGMRWGMGSVYRATKEWRAID